MPCPIVSSFFRIESLMRRAFVIIVFSVICTFSVLAIDAQPARLVKASNSVVKIGADLHYFSYKEPGVMTESGFLYGFSGSFERKIPHNLWFDFSSSIVSGDLNYDGLILYADGREEPISAVTPNIIFNLKATGGVFPEFNGFSVGPYTGIGYRFLVDDLADPSPEYGYTREQTYVYLPVGVRVSCRTKFSWMLDARLEYDVLLDASNRSHGGALGGSVVLPQDSGSGWRMAIALTPTGNANSTFSLESFLEIWNIDDSEIVGAYLEPENESSLFGVRFSVCFY